MNHQRLDAIEHNSNKVNVVNSIQFLGIIIDSSLTWREHTDYINSKLNSLRYMVRSLRPVLGLKMIMQIYFSYVHSVLNYGIIFWGTSPHSQSIFITQKRIVRCMMKAKPKDSCRELFKELGILTLYFQYIFSTLMFVVKHKDLLKVNIKVHEINTRHKIDFHVPSVRLMRIQKGIYYSGITLLNALPLRMKQAALDVKKFKYALKLFLIKNSFYSVEECFNMNDK
jgi:hypothetical protein